MNNFEIKRQKEYDALTKLKVRETKLIEVKDFLKSENRYLKSEINKLNSKYEQKYKQKRNKIIKHNIKYALIFTSGILIASFFIASAMFSALTITNILAISAVSIGFVSVKALVETLNVGKEKKEVIKKLKQDVNQNEKDINSLNKEIGKVNDLQSYHNSNIKVIDYEERNSQKRIELNSMDNGVTKEINYQKVLKG